MSLTNSQANSLDQLFQQKVLEKSGHRSLLGGRATVVHHFVQSRSNSIRWYIPAGIPLTHDQHQKIHNGTEEGKFLEKRIIEIMGQQWHEALSRRRYLVIKDSALDQIKIIDHLSGLRADYA